MFGGYTEVAAYYVNTPWQVSGEDGSAIDIEQLPQDYNAQNMCPDPWHKQATCQTDFIMIAEFSEQEGPKPLIIIPKDGGGTFDLNEFSVRIMSADFQTVSGSTFNMSEDTQVIMSETNNGLHAFVHHFTLYDYQARGFVRPFCMSYVTPDQDKLFSEFEDLSSEFKKVAHCFKSGNLDLFVKDLTHYLSDLHYTKQRYLEMEHSLQSLAEDDQHQMSLMFCEPQEATLLKSVTPSALDNIIKEVKAILEVTSNMLTEIEATARDVDNSAPPSQSDSASKPDTEDNLVLDNFVYSCSLHGRSPAHRTQWLDHRERAGSTSQIVSNWTDEKDVYKPKLVRTTKRKFEKSLRTLHELCMWGAKEGLNRLRILHKYFSRDLYVLHMEKTDAESMEPACSVLTLGRSIVINYFDHLQLNNGLIDVEWDSTNSYSCLDRKWFSSDTMASFHSADSFLSCVDDESNPKDKNTAAVPIAENITSDETQLKEDTRNSGHISSASSSFETAQDLSDMTQFEDDVIHRPVNLSDVCQQSIKMNIVSSVDHMTNFNQTSSGFGIQKLIMQFPGVCHVIYSLLTGRPTIVFATFRMEKDIRIIVNALSMFVPGYSNFSGIVPYHTSPLCITDIAHSKLIGLSRPERRKLEHMIPSSVRQYVTIFDVEKRTIWAPEYKGGLLTDMFNKRKSFTSELTFITYIYSCLYDLALKSFVYFHKFCLGSEEAKPRHISGSENTYRLSPCDRMLYTKKSICDLCKLHVNEQDASIAKYFSEVVKFQHVTRKDVSDSGCVTTTLEYVKCQWIKA